MKNSYTYLIAIFALALLLLLNACRRDNDLLNDCGQVACSLSLPLLTLDFVDKQGRDLLDPATPNHLDSGKIMQLNAGRISILPSAFTSANNGKRKMYIQWPSTEGTTFYLKLSETDQDTIVYRRKLIKSCCPTYQLDGFKYNNVTYTDFSKANFTILK